MEGFKGLKELSRHVKNIMELGKYNGHSYQWHTLYWDHIKSNKYTEFFKSGHNLPIYQDTTYLYAYSLIT